MATGVPTVQPALHYDWGRKFFRHRPEDPLAADAALQEFSFPGTILEPVMADPEGIEDSLFVGYHAAARPPRRSLVLWHGSRRIVSESLGGFFDGRYDRVSGPALGAIAPRLGQFIVMHPDTDPCVVVGLESFLAGGVSHETLERVFDAPVAVAMDGAYSDAAYVPSLRVYVDYDGARYGDSTKKLFYDRNGNPVPVELVAREVVKGLAYDAVHPNLFVRLFSAITGRPPSHFRPGQWGWAHPRASPFGMLATALAKIEDVQAAPVGGTLRALEALAARAPYKHFNQADGALPGVAQYITRARLESLLSTLGRRRYLAILRGMLAGNRVVDADWFVWQAATKRAFPLEVKSRGDTLRPSQKQSILYCQATGLLDYRLLEVLHRPPGKAFQAAG